MDETTNANQRIISIGTFDLVYTVENGTFSKPSIREYNRNRMQHPYVQNIGMTEFDVLYRACISKAPNDIVEKLFQSTMAMDRTNA